MTLKNISLSVTTDFRGQSGDLVGSVTYTNSPRGGVSGATASFYVAQFFIGGSDILGSGPGATITGNTGVNQLNVYGGGLASFGLGWMVFTNWSVQDKLQIYGGAGDDEIHGASVSCALFGGEGNDVLSSQMNSNTILDGGVGDDSLYGHVGNDAMYGGDGNDYLSGFAGADSLYGGIGNDSLAARSGLADGGDGIDSFVGNLSLAVVSLQIDVHDGGAGRDIGTGLALVGIERLNMIGGGEADTIVGGALRDVMNGATGNDLLQGLAGSDYILGSAGDDTVMGGGAGDFMVGGSGADNLVGGAGADRFIFNQVSDSTVAAQDIIVDFQQGQDRIDVSTFVETFHFIGQASFLLPSGAADYEIRYEKLAASTLVQVGYFGVDGDVVTMQIKLTGAFDLTANDFIF